MITRPSAVTLARRLIAGSVLLLAAVAVCDQCIGIASAQDTGPPDTEIIDPGAQCGDQNNPVDP